jgi:hypothetical protein
MADYIVHGKKGNGKSLVCVGRIRDALERGLPVATNLDLRLEHMLSWRQKNVRCYRLPDRPSVDDLNALGLGSESVDESTYGLIVLDEMATWLNARTFADKGRQALLDWFTHSRKKGWETYFICQNPNQIDKQVREALVELSVSCRRADRMRIPVIGWLSKALLFGHELRFPKVHIASVRYGLEKDAVVSDRWTYRGTDLYRAYDTRQVFKADYSDGLYSYLSPWHIKGRYLPPNWWDKLRAFCLGLVGRGGPVRSRVLKPKMVLVARLGRLSPDEAVRHWRRLDALGYWGKCAG